MPAMAREFRMFLLAIALPAVFVAVGGAWLLVHVWDSLWSGEREELDLRARIVADSIEDRIHGAGMDERRPPRGGEPPRRRGQMPSPRRFGRAMSPEKRGVVSAACVEVANVKASLVGEAEFEVLDARGERVYATPGWPEKRTFSVDCHLGPPAGNGTLRVARADGGSRMRARAVAIAAAGGVIVLLLISALVSGGVLFVRTLRRERRESRMKTDFIDNVSHELNTPLAGIRLTAELLADGRIPEGERRQCALESILAESDRLSRMVSELLDFSRLEKGTRRYSIETFDLAAFVSDPAVAQSAAAISDGRVRISAKGRATVSADKDALRQIATNLVSNAVKYSGGEIDIEVEGTEIRFMDRGPGVPPECAERIFERFYRVDDSLTRREGGSGLGLPIARALARGMGGDVTYSPRPGGGSVFTLALAPADGNNEEPNT